MDRWLSENLVCPRDHKNLNLEANHLVCPFGHVYPYVDDIPIMLLEEATPTLGACCKTLEQVLNLREVCQTNEGIDSQDIVDPYVQQRIWATCGIMYKPLANKLSRYPIPEFPLPQGEEQVLLDIGCNWGRWCISAAQKGYSPVGIDPSFDAIRAARRISDQLGLGINYVVGDARYLPFATGSIDVVFSYSVLQHFDKKDVRLTLADVARILKESGASLIQMPNTWGLRNIYNQLRKGFKEPTSFDVRLWSVSELEDTFTSLVGPTSLSVDGYFSLNAQMSDIDLLPLRYQAIILCSEFLRRISEKIKWMKYLADSLYVTSTRI